MLALDRDRQIVMSVGRFRQLAAAHIAALHFHDKASPTPLYRALERLVERKYLARIERRMVGGTGAGSGQYVYQLGREGWKLYGKGVKYWPYRAVDYHTIAIADAYVGVLELEHKGTIEILGFTTEPDSWVAVNGTELRPDLFIEVGDRGRQRRVSLWLEIDMGTERQKQITDKLAAYWTAYQNAHSLPVFPLVVFICPDDYRAKELRWMVEKLPKEQQALFLVSTPSAFGPLLFS